MAHRATHDYWFHDFSAPDPDMTDEEREEWLNSLPEWRDLLQREVVAGSPYFKSPPPKKKKGGLNERTD